ncbi:Hypothetical protein A7982_04301 [Minicystis rosea]|nr:Hypothetical protein A7982_04301 [Minicystis rosea]
MMQRRYFLRGLAGVAMALPFLETFAPKKAKAATYPPFAVFMRQANGVVQKTDEPEMFWPHALGALTKAGLAAESDRAVSVLADYADKLTMVRGVNFAFPGNGCGHSGGGNQCLTAAKVSDDPSGAGSLSMGESIDNRIARELQAPGVEPLTLYAGKMSGYLDEVLSYRGPKQLRAAERNPFLAYKKLFGASEIDPVTLEKLKAARSSVNDLVRGEMKALMSRKDLSQSDRDRLDLHFQSIRDLELNMACKLTDMEIAEMDAIQPGVAKSDNVQTIARMQMDIIALSFACGVVRTATLQIGDGNDSTEYTINGQKQYSYHWISHRIQGDGDVGAPIDNAVELHHEIDKIHGNLFKYLLDKLSAYSLGTGTLLDSGVAVWTNDLADKYHSYKNVPYILAGGCNGYLKTGQYIDAGGVNNNKMWNTVGAAVGCTKDGKTPMDDFGDPSLAPGFISAMLA